MRDENQKETAGPSTTLPRIPVEVGGVGELHAALFMESRTRGHVQRSVAGNREPPGASGRKRSKLLQCRWETIGRFTIHSSAASCSPAPLVRWARMKEAPEVE